MTTATSTKPLGIKAYGSIAHLPGSRMGPADRHCHEGQARIATLKPRDKHDRIIVQEKLDGSCMAVAKVDGEIIALGRAGYRAITSKYEQHIMFDVWVRENYERFDALLDEGERVVGEWLAQAHGTRYDLTDREPFVAFDLMIGHERMTYERFRERQIKRLGRDYLGVPAILALRPIDTDFVAHQVTYRGNNSTYGFHGALDPVEGAVWRVERHGKVDFLVKWVRPDKVDGAYFPEITGQPPVWNWKPEGWRS